MSLLLPQKEGSPCPFSTEPHRKSICHNDSCIYYKKWVQLTTMPHPNGDTYYYRLHHPYVPYWALMFDASNWAKLYSLLPSSIKETVCEWGRFGPVETVFIPDTLAKHIVTLHKKGYDIKRLVEEERNCPGTIEALTVMEVMSE